MNFDFDPQQLELRDTVARALADAAPFEGHATRGDDDHAVWSTLADLGLFGLMVPEAQGGLGLTLIDVALIAEEFGAALAPLSITDTLIACDVIARHGSAGQLAQWLPRIAEGHCRIAIGWIEEASGYDPVRMQTGIKGQSLNGTKLLVPHADKANAFLIPVQNGVALIDSNAPGVTLMPHESLDPTCGHHSVAFDSVVVTAEAVLNGFAPQDATARLFDVAATVYAGMALGIARETMNRAATYARERIQFDRPIGSFQAIKHKCADMFTSVEAARAAAYYGFCAVAEAGAEGPHAASMAKAFCGDVAVRCCQDAIQVHGGMGFTWELGLHHFLRRAKVMGAAWGDGDFHRERVMEKTLEALARPETSASRSAA
jgi:alkylation response protein AidB-like acyl-CoA dehydrogenase